MIKNDCCQSFFFENSRISKNPEKQPETAKVDPPIMTIQMSMNFAGSHLALAEKFQRGMDIIRADGTFQKISKKYFGRQNTKRSVFVDMMHSRALPYLKSPVCFQSHSSFSSICGNSFTKIQNRPICLTASTNSTKRTGLTTYALMPIR